MRWFCRLLNNCGLRVKDQATGGALGIFLQFVGENRPFLATGGTLDADFAQRFVAFKPRTMLVAHISSFDVVRISSRGQDPISL